MKETIFFAVFESKYKKIDRRAFFEEEKTLKEFNVWLEEKREDIIKQFNGQFILTNIQFITNK